jgi:hypothetical protein
VAQRDRFLDPQVAEGFKRAEQELRPFWRTYARPVEVHFEVAGATRQVAHLLGTVPSGYLVTMQTGALYAVTPDRWTEDLALLQAPVANTRAVLTFYTLREEPTRV